MIKKLLAIMVLGIVFNESSSADMPNTFFGIKLGSNVIDYTSNECFRCADGKSKIFNHYSLNPEEPNKDFSSYNALTSVKSKLIAAISIHGDFVYDDWQGKIETHLNTCRGEQDNLLTAIMEKYKKDYPKLIYKKSSGNLNIFGASDTIAISLTCEPVDPDPEWKFYKKEGLILSSKYFDLAEKENIELGLNKTNSQGF